ncbi:MAG: peroxiredoxin, partial [Candidatus Limnocylindria bacterium]
PKDDTPGCTAQACGLRDSWAAVSATGVEIFGVSPDSVKKHVKFREKYALPYRLLSDEGHLVAEAFGVWIEKTFAGRTYFGNERTTFVIGADGHIEQVLPQVKPDAHVDQLLEALAA